MPLAALMLSQFFHSQILTFASVSCTVLVPNDPWQAIYARCSPRLMGIEARAQVAPIPTKSELKPVSMAAFLYAAFAMLIAVS